MASRYAGQTKCKSKKSTSSSLLSSDAELVAYAMRLKWTF